MTWQLIFSRSAQKNLRRFPLNDRRRIEGALEELTSDPLQGDVRPLRDQPYEFRLRVGDYRIFFGPDHVQRQIRVHEDLRRTTSTYRRR